MRRLFCFLGLILCTLSAQAQAGSFGNATNNATGFGTGSQNFLLSNYIIIGTVPVNVNACNVAVSSGGTTGGKIDCVLLAAPSTSTQGTSAICVTTITETGASGTYTQPMSGCGTLTAGETLWLGIVMNDSTAILGTASCTCTGPSGSGTTQSLYTALTYGSGSYPTIPGTPSGTDTNYLGTYYITTTPATPTFITNELQGEMF